MIKRTMHFLRRGAFFALAATLGGCEPGPGPVSPGEPNAMLGRPVSGWHPAIHRIRIRAIPLTDYNGGRAFTLTRWDLAAVISQVNQIFASTDIQFSFDPWRDWEPRADTYLNTMDRDLSNWWLRGNAIAAERPDRITVFFRWGEDGGPTGNGFAYPPHNGAPVPASAPLPSADINFVAMPNTLNLVNQGLVAGKFFAHELGHYLGLFHTFPGWSNNTIYATNNGPLSAVQADSRVVNYIVNNGWSVAALDGDGLADTPYDPGTLVYVARYGSECGGPTPIMISGSLGPYRYSYGFTPDRDNVMSYFDGCSGSARFSLGQRQLMLSTLATAPRSQLTR